MTRLAPNPETPAQARAAATADKPSPPIAPEGIPICIGFIAGALALTAGAAFLSPILAKIVGTLCLALCAWCFWFFRDPRRSIPSAPGLVIAPADGRVVRVDHAPAPRELGLDDTPMTRVCIFMNVFNVHVNRAPVAGVVRAIRYIPGRFFNASLDKASEHNERSILSLETPDAQTVIAVQIAGLVARRIVCRTKEGAQLDRAERYGLIRFGSRVDVYMPRHASPAVKVGDTTVAGETVIARLGEGP